MIELAIITPLFIFAYHYVRNGKPWDLGPIFGDIVWAAFFSLGSIVFLLPDFLPSIFLLLFVGAFLATEIPHGFAQNAGFRTIKWDNMNPIPFIGKITLLKWWPAFWMSGFKDKLSFAVQDALGMASVGFIRGILVFMFVLRIHFFGALIAILTTTVWQPFAYWLGQKIPFATLGNTAHSTEWGEFLIGPGWALALAAALWV